MPCYIMKREVKCEDKEINESEVKKLFKGR